MGSKNPTFSISARRVVLPETVTIVSHCPPAHIRMQFLLFLLFTNLHMGRWRCLTAVLFWPQGCELSILEVEDQELTVEAFFENHLLPLLSCSSGSRYSLDYASVGPKKDSLDRIGHGVKVCAVINTFGHFMKFFVILESTSLPELPYLITNSNLPALEAKCNSMSDIRKVAEKKPVVIAAVEDCISPVKALLTSIFVRLQPKGKPFKCITSATRDEFDEFWSAI